MGVEFWVVVDVGDVVNFEVDGFWLVNDVGKVMFYDGCLGELYEVFIIVGYVYILKLFYFVDDKIYVWFMGLYLMIM